MSRKHACQCRRHKKWGFNPWVRKIPWRRKWQPTPVFLPGEPHTQSRLAGYSLWGHKLDVSYHHHSCNWKGCLNSGLFRIVQANNYKTEEELSCWSLLMLLSPWIAPLLPHFPVTHQEHLGWCSKKIWNKQASFLEVSSLPPSAHFHLLILSIGLLACQVLQPLQTHSGISFTLFPILVVQGPSSYT